MQMCCNFCKGRRKLPQTSLISLYYSFAYPYFIYCNHVWGNKYRTILDKLFLVQKKIIRVIKNSPYRAYTEPLFLANQILNVHDINVYTVGVFMYNTIETDVPTLFTSFFRHNSDLHEYPTSRAHDLHVPRGRINVRIFSMRINGAMVWNSIHERVREAQTEMLFKRSLRKYLHDRKSQP